MIVSPAMPWLSISVPRRPFGRSLFALAVRALSGVAARTASSPEDAAAADTLRRFEAQVLPHLDAAYTLARYLCRDRDAADDIVQTAFLRAYRAFSGFRGDNARAWVLAIVRNCHRDWRQDMRRRAATSAEPETVDSENDAESFEVASDDDDPEIALLRQAEADLVRGVLADMPEPMREILVLRDVEDCSYREIAQVLEVPLGTVMSRLARARLAFAARWRKRDGDGSQP